jgi:hypothetical protein
MPRDLHYGVSEQAEASPVGWVEWSEPHHVESS